jgi:hypothetical protein
MATQPIFPRELLSFPEYLGMQCAGRCRQRIVQAMQLAQILRNLGYSHTARKDRWPLPVSGLFCLEAQTLETLGGRAITSPNMSSLRIIGCIAKINPAAGNGGYGRGRSLAYAPREVASGLSF